MCECNKLRNLLGNSARSVWVTFSFELQGRNTSWYNLDETTDQQSFLNVSFSVQMKTRRSCQRHRRTLNAHQTGSFILTLIWGLFDSGIWLTSQHSKNVLKHVPLTPAALPWNGPASRIISTLSGDAGFFTSIIHVNLVSFKSLKSYDDVTVHQVLSHRRIYYRSVTWYFCISNYTNFFYFSRCIVVLLNYYCIHFVIKTGRGSRNKTSVAASQILLLTLVRFPGSDVQFKRLWNLRYIREI